MQPYRVLLSDDDIPYAKSLIPLADFHNFDIRHFATWEEAQADLEQSFNNYDAIILDALGQKNSDSKRNDIGALTQAVMWLQKKEGEGFYIPYVINSAFVETSVKTGFDNIEHFDKTQKEEKKLFETLKKLIDQKDSFQIKKKFYKTFNSIGGKYLPETLSPTLVEVIKKMDENTVDKSWFNSIRDIIEEIFKRSSAIDNNFLPEILLKQKQNGRPNLKLASIYWSGREVDMTKIGGTTMLKAVAPILPPHINWLMSGLIEVVNILSHNYADNISIYAYRSAVNTLLEVITWYKPYVDMNYPEI